MTAILRAVAAVGLVLAGVTVVSGAAWSDREGSLEKTDPEGSLEKTCARIVGKPATGGVDKATVPAGGSPVTPGETIDVTLTWDTGAWSGDRLHKVLNCVSMNGVLDLGLSGEEKPTANDGVFEATVVVPAVFGDPGVPLDNEICIQGFVSGKGAAGAFEQERSEPVCFPVELAAVVAEPVPPPVEEAVEDPAPADPPRVAGEAVALTPEPAPPAVEAEVVAAEAPLLPRTGLRQGLEAAAGLMLMLGGLAVIGGARRTPAGRPAGQR